MLAATFMLGGLLPLDSHVRERWAPAGAWRMPVGDPYQLLPERSANPGTLFYVLRSVEWDGDHASHQGADLGCGSEGAPVHAAAAGIVVRAADHGLYGGFGTHVVLAHRLGDGVLAYSVYAHLRESSLRVRAGQAVQAGQMLARVGATGHVTGPHLHFEVRTADDPGQRWELTGVEDPLAFVEERLPTHRGDTTGVEPWLEWGECAALLSPGARAEDAVTREAWWRMLAAAVRGPLLDPALDPRALRTALLKARVLPADDPGGPGGTPIGWHELARDLGRLRSRGVRLGPGPFRRPAHRERLEKWFGTPAPAARMSALSAREGRPSLCDAVLLIGDLTGPIPDPPVRKPLAKSPLRTRPPGVPVPRDTTAVARARRAATHGVPDTTAPARVRRPRAAGVPDTTAPARVRRPALHGVPDTTASVRARRLTAPARADSAARVRARAAKVVPDTTRPPRPRRRARTARPDSAAAAPAVRDSAP